ncbi:hypothetical protein GH714_017029 [Hevea brasiliensis]|uniref:Transposase-associated domain-containing protein n=1 Tax=Hevea brasiliensis TaxID=3981 RepID=A0A6A6KC83_HEVBR|nr:hypothetical protein GH714_017029 [Hevea brasiliensis]
MGVSSIGHVVSSVLCIIVFPYGVLFLSHITEDITDSPNFADGVPKGLRIQDVLVLITVLLLIKDKIQDVNMPNSPLVTDVENRPCNIAEIMAPSKGWMDLVGDRLNDVYLRGVEEFLDYAFKKTGRRGEVRCPCVKCSNTYSATREVVGTHLKVYGIIRNYTFWYHHGERVGESESNLESVQQSEDEPSNEMHDILRDYIQSFVVKIQMIWIQISSLVIFIKRNRMRKRINSIGY